MFAYIGLALMLVGFAAFVFTSKYVFDEIRILFAAVLVCCGLAAIISNAAATMPDDTDSEPASVTEAREACRKLARQAEADAWFESQRK